VAFILVVISGELSGFQEKYYSLRGKVTDESGTPLAGATVIEEKSNNGVLSDRDGSFVLSGLRQGLCRVRISFVGYEKISKEINISDDTQMSFSLRQTALEAGEVIINATRAGEHTPLAYVTIDNDKIKNQNTGQDIPFILGLTPSLVETSEAGTGIGYTSLRIRGTDANRINVTIDGIPLNDPESQQVFWVDLPDLATSVDNIQVQRGTGTSSNGAAAFGATVSIQTKSPEYEPFAQVSSSYGSFNTYKNSFSAGTGLLAGKYSFNLRLSQLRSDGYVRRTWSDHRSAYLSGSYISGRSRLQANVILGEEHTGIGWWGVPKEMLTADRRYNPAGEYTDEAGKKRYYSNESDNYFQNHFQLLYNLRISENLTFNTALHYTTGLGYYEEYAEKDSLKYYGIAPITIGDTIIKATDLIRRKWMKNEFSGMIWSARYRKDRIDAVIGGGANYYRGNHYGRILWMKEAGNIEKDYQWYLGHGAKGEVSLYAKADYSVSDRISLFGDLQYRYVNYRIFGLDDDLKELAIDHQYSFFNPKAGLFLTLSEKQNAFISISTAHREPTRTDFTEAAGDPGATPKAESLYDTEAGYRFKGNILSFSITLYGMFYKDQLVPTGQLSSTGYSIMTNVGRSYRTGAEFAAGLKPAAAIKWDFSITLSSNKIRNFTEYFTDYDTTSWEGTYMGRYLGTVDIAYSPSVIGSSDLVFSVMKNCDLHLISKYVGKQYFDNTMSSDRMIDPYFVNNVMINFKPEVKNLRNTEFQLLVNNILNSKYESNAYGGNWFEDGIEKTWSYYFPQAGTNFMLKATLLF
jgi:iron complex outermembrane recepter protein